MAEVVASAIAVPDREDPVDDATAENSMKRRQSELSVDKDGSSSKRQRTSPGKTSPRAKRGAEEDVVSSAARPRSVTPVEAKIGSHTKPERQEQDGRDTRRKSAAKAPDEKQRSKRLFGALLGNLNRPSDRTSKRRAEIEQRKKAELQKQDDERIEDRQKRLERLAIQRKKKQVMVDEQSMHIRHKNLLSKANFLQTQAEPKLYYRPWDLTPDEEDLVEQQLKEAQEQVDRELAEWEHEKRKRLGISDAFPEPRIAPDVNPTAESADVQRADHEEVQDTEMGDGKPNGSTDLVSEIATTTNDEKAQQQAGVPTLVPDLPQPADSAIDVEEGKQEDSNGEKVVPDQPERGDDEAEEGEGENGKAHTAEKARGSADDQVQDAANGKAKDDKDELDDDGDDGDHIVEGDEDNVIY